MLVNYFSFTDDNHITRYACVVDGQPFYCSSGTSSGLENAWMPFQKFGQRDASTGNIHKLDIAYNYRHENINEYFPVVVANALLAWSDESIENNWGRFGDMKSLFIACLLSNTSAVPASIRSAVIAYVGPDNYHASYLWAAYPTLCDCGSLCQSRQLNDDTFEECNEKLISLGAAIPDEVDINNLAAQIQQTLPIIHFYPDVLDPQGDLQQFIDRIPSVSTQMMRCMRQKMVNHPEALPAVVENPIQPPDNQGP